jgi:hypothetical protein
MHRISTQNIKALVERPGLFVLINFVIASDRRERGNLVANA